MLAPNRTEQRGVLRPVPRFCFQRFVPIAAIAVFGAAAQTHTATPPSQPTLSSRAPEHMGGDSFNGRLVTHGPKGIRVYQILGFLEEYVGRLTADDDDTVERFYPNERAKAETFGRWLNELAQQQGIPTNAITKEIDRDSFVRFRSAILARALNRLYLEQKRDEVHDGPRGRIPRASLFVSRAMFDEVERQVKLAYISGAYCRYGRAHAIGFANAAHKATVLAGLLRDVGCKDVQVTSITDRIPNTNIVTFSSCRPAGWFKSSSDN